MDSFSKSDFVNLGILFFGYNNEPGIDPDAGYWILDADNQYPECPNFF